MSDYVYKSSEIVSLSVTEILLIIIFGLVLVAQIISTEVFDATQSAEILEGQQGRAEVASEQLTDIVNQLNEITGKDTVDWAPFTSLSARLDEAHNQLEILKAELQSLIAATGDSSANLPEVWTKLVRAARALEGTPSGFDEIVSHLESLNSENRELSKDNQELKDQLAEVRNEFDAARELLNRAGVNSVADLAEKNKSLSSQVGGLTAQVKALNNKLTRLGYGYQPCWSDELGAIQYLMRVEIGEGTLTTNAIFPESRRASLETLPVKESDLTRRFSLQEFTSAFFPIYRWSKSEGQDCRFFVEIVDRDSDTKDAYKAGRSAIENLFFIRNLD